jgi:hypothetical protein
MVQQDIEIAKALSNLYSEVFMRRRQPTSIISLNNNPDDLTPLDEVARVILITNTNQYVWGPGGFSPETDSSGMAGRWGEATWS